MFDDLREWLSDHLRYVLILLGVLLLAIILFIAVRSLSGLGNKGNGVKKEMETSDEVIVGDGGAEAAQPETYDLSNVTLTQNDAAVLPTVQQYYKAKANKDMEALNVVVADLKDSTKAEIEADTWNEGYENVETYSLAGPGENTYIAYVTFDEKIVNINTPAPSLEVLYLKQGNDGSLRIADPGDDRSVVNYINQLNSSASVQLIVEEVTARYEEVEKNEPALASLMAQLSEQETELVFEEVPGALENNSSSDGSLVEAIAVCNVRGEPSETGTIYGMLDSGTQVTKIEELDNGWTAIEYHGLRAYVSSQFLQDASGAGAAFAEAPAAEDTATDAAASTGPSIG